MSNMECVELFASGRVTFLDIGGHMAWLVDGRPPTDQECKLLSEATPEDIEDARWLLQNTLESLTRRRVDSVRFVTDLVQDFLDKFPSWGLNKPDA